MDVQHIEAIGLEALQAQFAVAQQVVMLARTVLVARKTSLR